MSTTSRSSSIQQLLTSVTNINLTLSHLLVVTKLVLVVSLLHPHYPQDIHRVGFVLGFIRKETITQENFWEIDVVVISVEFCAIV